jgi:hypothetical protein
MRRSIAAALTMCAVAVGSLVVASPAQAIGCPGDPEQVKVNRNTIALPGKPDIQLAVSLCLHDERGFYQAVQVFDWASTTGGDGWGKKFNYLKAVVWVQKNDVNKCSNTESPPVNNHEGGSYTFYCAWDSANTSGVSADGKIVYDVADDGIGEQTWQLTGTS